MKSFSVLFKKHLKIGNIFYRALKFKHTKINKNKQLSKVTTVPLFNKLHLFKHKIDIIFYISSKTVEYFLALDRTRVSDRKATVILTETVVSLGHDSYKLKIN